MNKKRLIILWVIFGVMALVILWILPYGVKEELLFIFPLVLIMIFISKIDGKSNKIKELGKIISYLENRFDLLRKIANGEGHSNEEFYLEEPIQYTLKEIVKKIKGEKSTIYREKIESYNKQIEEYQKKWGCLKKGMTQSQVSDILGSPKKISENPELFSTIWSYSMGSVEFHIHYEDKLHRVYDLIEPDWEFKRLCL